MDWRIHQTLNEMVRLELGLAEGPVFEYLPKVTLTKAFALVDSRRYKYSYQIHFLTTVVYIFQGKENVLLKLIFQIMLKEIIQSIGKIKSKDYKIVYNAKINHDLSPFLKLLISTRFLA